MNKTIVLVNHWGQFESNHPNGSIEDFCRYYLGKQQRTKLKGVAVGGVIPSFTDGLLLKIIGRIQKLNMNYANLALKETGLNQIEEYGILQTVKHGKNPKKTEVIYANLLELSSGTDMLSRLKSRGLIKEYNDMADKRSKRIELTSKGEKAIELSKLKIFKNGKMLLDGLSEDDKELCIQVLTNIEIKFSALWQKHKGKVFEEIFEEVVGEKA
ncbi:MAG: MarR family winged helix-turn-helix transcriptional regulator [Ginsengibacter sp.]